MSLAKLILNTLKEICARVDTVVPTVAAATSAPLERVKRFITLLLQSKFELRSAHKWGKWAWQSFPNVKELMVSPGAGRDSLDAEPPRRKHQWQLRLLREHPGTPWQGLLKRN